MNKRWKKGHTPREMVREWDRIADMEEWPPP